MDAATAEGNRELLREPPEQLPRAVRGSGVDREEVPGERELLRRDRGQRALEEVRALPRRHEHGNGTDRAHTRGIIDRPAIQVERLAAAPGVLAEHLSRAQERRSEEVHGASMAGDVPPVLSHFVGDPARDGPEAPADSLAELFAPGRPNDLVPRMS